MTRRDPLFVLSAIALAIAAAPAVAEPAPVESWGLANVSYEAYRKDSLECGLQGYYADVSQTKQAQAFVGATRQLEATDNSNYVAPGTSPEASASAWANQAQRYEQIRQGIRPDQKMLELKQGMTAVVSECLRQRGYVKFRLTDEQGKQLATLKKGSDERREYLHGLAADPAVLKAQAVPTAEPSTAHR